MTIFIALLSLILGFVLGVIAVICWLVAKIE